MNKQKINSNYACSRIRDFPTYLLMNQSWFEVYANMNWSVCQKLPDDNQHECACNVCKSNIIDDKSYT